MGGAAQAGYVKLDFTSCATDRRHVQASVARQVKPVVAAFLHLLFYVGLHAPAHLHYPLPGAASAYLPLAKPDGVILLSAVQLAVHAWCACTMSVSSNL